MAIAFGGTLGNGEGAAEATTVTFNTTATVPAGSRIVLMVGWYANQTPSGSGGGLSWALDKQQNNVGDSALRGELLSADAPAGLASGTTITITFSGAGAFTRGVTACYFTGIASASYLDGTGGGSATTGPNNPWTISPGITTTNADDVIVAGAYITFRNTTSTPAGSFLEAVEFYDATNNATYTIAYQIVAATGTYTPSGNWGSDAQAWMTAAAAYKAAAAAVAYFRTRFET